MSLTAVAGSVASLRSILLLGLLGLLRFGGPVA